MKTAEQDTLHTWFSLFIQQLTLNKSMATGLTPFPDWAGSSWRFRSSVIIRQFIGQPQKVSLISEDLVEPLSYNCWAWLTDEPEELFQSEISWPRPGERLDMKGKLSSGIPGQC